MGCGKNRYYIQPNTTNIYIDDARSTKFKPSGKYLNYIETLLKQSKTLKEKVDSIPNNTKKKKDLKATLTSNDREIYFQIINDKTIASPGVGALLSKYGFTEKPKFDKL